MPAGGNGGTVYQIAVSLQRRTPPDHEFRCVVSLSQVVGSWDHARRGGWDVDYTEPYEDGLVLDAQRRYTNLCWSGVEARYISDLAPEKVRCVTVSSFFPWWRFYERPTAENRNET